MRIFLNTLGVVILFALVIVNRKAPIEQKRCVNTKETRYIGYVAFQVDTATSMDELVMGSAEDEKTGEFGYLYGKTIYCLGKEYNGLFFQKDLIAIMDRGNLDSTETRIINMMNLFSRRLKNVKIG